MAIAERLRLPYPCATRCAPRRLPWMRTVRDRELAVDSGLTPEAAIVRLTTLYENATDSLKQALEDFLKDRLPPSPERRQQFCYPKLSVSYKPEGPQPPTSRAYAKFQGPGVYSTTITQPRHFRP